MHIYNHRIFDRYDREVISLAILADDDPDWRPSRYGYTRWGFHTSTEFPTVKLQDYATREQAMEVDSNPFAMVVLAHLKTLETRRSPTERHAWKLRLVKGLYERGMDAEDVRRLFQFIDWIMDLPEGLEQRFREEIIAYQQEKRMPFMTIFERVGMEKGLEIGRQEGKEEGLLEGRLEGIQLGLTMKFGTKGLELMPEIREIQDHELLRIILGAIPTTDSPEELRRRWKRGRRSKKAKPE
jgi:hypothetical protein